MEKYKTIADLKIGDDLFYTGKDELHAVKVSKLVKYDEHHIQIGIHEDSDLSNYTRNNSTSFVRRHRDYFTDKRCAYTALHEERKDAYKKAKKNVEDSLKELNNATIDLLSVSLKREKHLAQY